MTRLISMVIIILATAAAAFITALGPTRGALPPPEAGMYVPRPLTGLEQRVRRERWEGWKVGVGCTAGIDCDPEINALYENFPPPPPAPKDQSQFPQSATLRPARIKHVFSLSASCGAWICFRWER